VGVGQVELDVAEVSDTTIVVLVPAFGDAIQAMKAGLMEIGDLFVINKCDRDGADRAVLEIESMLQLKADADWKALVIRTIATESGGVDDLFEAIDRHREFLKSGDLLLERRRKRIESEVRNIVETRLSRELWGSDGYGGELDGYVDSIMHGNETPVGAARKILEAKGLGEVFGGFKR
jgi:LAO/AO transport system kinase